MEYSFQKFTPVQGRFTPLLSIVESGFIGVSSGFVRKYKISGAKAVLLYYDKANKAVGISFEREETADTLPFKLTKNNSGQVNIKQFAVEYDIDIKRFKGKYEPEVTEYSGQRLFVIRLKNASQNAGSSSPLETNE